MHTPPQLVPLQGCLRCKIARLETTERDIEESKEKHVKRLLKIDTFWIFRNTWRMLNRLWKHSYKRQRVSEKVWRRK